MKRQQRIMKFIETLGCLAVLLIAVLAVNLQAQVAGGTILGTVKDPSGAVLPKVQLTVRNVATGVETPATSNADGYYSVANLVPGTYDVTASLANFAKEVATSVAVAVGSQTTVDLTMKIGTTEQKVVVSGAAAAVETTNSTLSGVVGEQTIRELPLNGRDWTQLATLEPGVNTVRAQEPLGSERGQRGLGTQMTISGGRPQQNNYRLDGVNINDYSNGGPGSVMGLNLGVDAVAEFSVLTSNYSAEYGRTSGGVINAVTRSGTNNLHGGGYYFRRDSALDTRNYFDGPDIPPFYRHQYGGSIGGAVQKDKTFFFGDYEGINQSLGVTQVDTMPTAAARAGNIHDANGNPITVAVNPLIKPYLQFFPLPNGAAVGPDTGIYSFAAQNNEKEEFATSRLDHYFSANDKVFGTYMFDQGRTASPDQTNAKVQQFRSRRQLFVVEENHTFSSSFLNAARFGVSRVTANIQESVQSIIPGADDVSLGTVPGRAAGQISFPGTTPFLGGFGGIPFYNFYWTSIQGYDDAMISHGKHTVKFGASLERIRDDMFGVSNPNGVWKFSSLQNFLTDTPKSLSAPLAGSVSPRYLRQWVIGIYLNDDYRLSSKLTLNLGIRYETSTVPTELNGKLSTLRNVSDATPHTGDPYFNNPTRKNFEPRIGLAWDPTGSGKTAVRAGFGIYDVLPLPYEYELPAMLSMPFFELGQKNNPGVGSFPTKAYSTLGPASFRGFYVDPNPKRNYVYQYNLNVQRQISHDFTVMLAYVGSRGIHQPFRTDTINYVLPSGKNSAGQYFWPLPIGSGDVINPNFGRLDGLMWINDSYYNSGQAKVSKLMGHGLHLQGTYTWGRSIDTGSASLAGDPYSNSVAVLPFFDPKLRKGLSDFNVSHNGNISMIWTIPGSQARSGFAGWAANGWQLGGIYTASTGTPLTPIIDGDPLGTNGSDAFAFPDVVNGCGSRVNPGNPAHYINSACYAFPAPGVLGNASRNSIVGPGLSNLDMSFVKNNTFHRWERLNVQFRAEVFNILNHTNFAAPLATQGNTSLFDETGATLSSGGQITSTQTTSRETQLAIKVTF
jgi:hypothetical protein